jgi:hypothetical protein
VATFPVEGKEASGRKILKEPLRYGIAGCTAQADFGVGERRGEYADDYRRRLGQRLAVFRRQPP